MIIKHYRKNIGMNQKIEDYTNRLEALAQVANEGDKAALKYAVTVLQQEHYRASLKMIST